MIYILLDYLILFVKQNLCASKNEGTEVNFCLRCSDILTKTYRNSDYALWIVTLSSM